MNTLARSLAVATAVAACLALVLPSAALAQERRDCLPEAALPTAQTFAAAARQARDRGLLWRVTKDGRSSFLYGTMHVGKAEWMAPGPLMRQALAQSDTIALELDPLDASVQREMLAAMGHRAPVVLPGPLQARLRKAWDAACLPAQALATMPVELQAATLSISADRREGLESVYGSEVLISMMGHGSGRQVVSLETVALQMRFMLAASDAEAAEMVQSALDEMDSGGALEGLRHSLRAWDSGDLDDFSRYEQWCECMKTAADRAMMTRLLDGRNPGLAARIDELHGQGQRVFAAVGALHMTGASGLPSLLAARGYAVQRLR